MDLFDRYKNDKVFVLDTHVFVNVSHFRKLLNEFPWHSQPDWVQWGLLEATLVKARALTDFLITDALKHSDDFLARSMVSNWVQQSSDFSELRELVNKHVAHFAQQRFIGDRQDSAISSGHLILLLRSVELAFLRFEKELEKVDSELFGELTRQIPFFHA
jgi:hypothetical protein